MTPEAEVVFLQATKGMRFTYSKQIAEYVDKKVWVLAVKLNQYNEELRDPDRIEQGVARQRAAIMMEILHELSNSEKVFSKYLQLRH